VVVLAGVLLVLALHQRRMSLRMRSLAMTDELTGVPNRRAVLGRLESVLAHGAAGPCSMLIIDIDHFKSINDQHGHAEGDAALKLVTAALRDAIPAPGFVGRLGGEEFVAVLPSMGDEAACDIAETIRRQVMAIDSLSWLGERRITVSIGVTTRAEATTTAGGMLHSADQALYEAKRSGRNCVKVQPKPANAEAPASSVAPSQSAAQVGFA
jgi:diguanylate cyclase (GGDEF)-like protein